MHQSNEESTQDDTDSSTYIETADPNIHRQNLLHVDPERKCIFPCSCLQKESFNFEQYAQSDDSIWILYLIPCMMSSVTI